MSVCVCVCIGGRGWEVKDVSVCVYWGERGGGEVKDVSVCVCIGGGGEGGR